MSKRIFRNIVSVSIIVLVASLIIATGFLHEYFNKAQLKQMREHLSFTTEKVNEIGPDYLDGFRSSTFRYTLIKPDGSVIYDSRANPKKMTNHRSREEVAEAIKHGVGSSSRYSSTLTERTFYKAKKLDNGNIIRISSTQITLGALYILMSPAILAILLSAIILSIILSQKMTKKIIKPLYELDLENPEKSDCYDELVPLVKRLNLQQHQILSQMNELSQRTEEFKQITACMNEGLVILDPKSDVISINPAAKSIFKTDDRSIGNDFITVDRSLSMKDAIETAFANGHCEFRENRDGIEYQFILTRMESNEKVLGLVILCIDVSESTFAERNRQEFTANVSHELKTPLQSIIGSSELLENHLVKPDDVDKFISNIKNEASRLVSLINDIINLSELDECVEKKSEPVHLCDVAKEVIEILTPSAFKKNIDLNLTCDPCTINGNRHYIYEILYNLCDNAIRYNYKNGHINIDINDYGDNVVLSVSDSGMGIPAEHINRIFERFYRVDKSHSKETGGTGLGLSIVKHAVAYHNAEIEVKSEEGKGTVMKITFKK